ncbi:MAG: hypothetical protein HQM09_00935 [Candidatus Riflebacteria bacterium]|nr:hypothetical protein [Candidatus Riflebacteria bacterium]
MNKTTKTSSDDSDESESGDGELVFDGVIDHQGGLDIHLPNSLSEHDLDELQEKIREALKYWKKSGQRGNLPDNHLIQLIEKRSRPPSRLAPTVFSVCRTIAAVQRRILQNAPQSALSMAGSHRSRNRWRKRV